MHDSWFEIRPDVWMHFVGPAWWMGIVEQRPGESGRWVGVVASAASDTVCVTPLDETFDGAKLAVEDWIKQSGRR